MTPDEAFVQSSARHRRKSLQSGWEGKWVDGRELMGSEWVVGRAPIKCPGTFIQQIFAPYENVQDCTRDKIQLRKSVAMQQLKHKCPRRRTSHAYIEHASKHTDVNVHFQMYTHKDARIHNHTDARNHKHTQPRRT